MTSRDHALAMRLYLEQLCRLIDRNRRVPIAVVRASWPALLAASTLASSAGTIGCSSEPPTDSQNDPDGSVSAQDAAADVQGDAWSEVHEGTMVAMYSAPMSCTVSSNRGEPSALVMVGLCAAATTMRRKRRSL